MDDQYRSFVGQRIQEAKKHKGKISVDDVETALREGLELYYSAKGETRARDSKGDFADFLEN